MAKTTYREQYDQIIEKIEAFKLDLNDLYSITDLENREFKFRQLKDKYGGELDRYYNKLQYDLEQVKKILTSKYIHSDPYETIGGHAIAEYVNEFMETGPFGWIKSEVNPDYDETFDLNSEWNKNRRLEEGVTLEDDINSRNQKELTNSFTFSNYTDAWGRDYDHPDFGIDPSFLNRTIVTPEVTEVKDGSGDGSEEVKDGSEEVKDGSEVTLLKDGNEEVKDGNEEVKDGNEEVTETPNRLELMTASIRENPSSIQEDLINNKGWTAERLAKLRIKDQDFQKAKGNKELMIQFKKDKAAGVYA